MSASVSRATATSLLAERLSSEVVVSNLGQALELECRLTEVRDDHLVGEALGQMSRRRRPAHSGAHPSFPPVSSAGRMKATGSDRV